MDGGRVRVVLIGACVVLFAASGVALARGCSDDGFPDDIAGICREVADRFAELQPGPPLTDEAAALRVDGLLETSTEADEALGDLRDEAPDEPAFAAWLEARAEVSARLRQAQEALAAGESGAYDAALEAANGDARKRRRLARAADLDECARLAGSGA